MSKRLAPPLLGLLVLCASSGVALADPSPQDRATAKGDWTQGKRLMAVKNYEEAADSFKKAIGRDPKAQYQLDLARALVETGNLVEAAKLCAEVQKNGESNADKEKAGAKSLADSLATRIPTLTLTVSGPDADAVTATIDGQPAKIGVEIRENPGSYEVEAKAPHFETFKKKASLAEGEKFEMTLKFKPADGDASGETSDDKKSTHSVGNMVPAGIAFGVGGAGVVLGTVFGILAFTTTNDLSAVCKNNLCPPSAANDIDQTKLYGDISTGTLVVGGVGVATGIILALTVGRGSSTKTDDKKADQAFVVPYVWPGGGGIAGRF